jgi:hypothetical protein
MNPGRVYPRLPLAERAPSFERRSWPVRRYCWQEPEADAAPDDVPAERPATSGAPPAGRDARGELRR